MPKHDLNIVPPLMNAAGSLGFTPDLHSQVDWSRLGAFITNPISLLPRTPAHGERCIAYPGGFLLHTGYPNPGLAQVLRRYTRYWQRSPIPVIVHLLAQGMDEVARMARQLEAVEGIVGLEIGLPGDVSIQMLEAVTRAACGELPVILRLPMERALEMAPKGMNSGAEAISLAPPRGVLPASSGGCIQGRLYGPAVFPLALNVVRELAQSGIPVIGAGGIYTQENLDAILATGALAVQLDSILWRQVGYSIFSQR